MNSPRRSFLPQFISRILVLSICVSFFTTYLAAQKMADSKNSNLNRSFSSDAPQVDPVLVVVSGNPNCAAINESTNPAFSNITSNFGFKLDNEPRGSGTVTFEESNDNPIRELTGGAPADPDNTVTYNIQNGKNFTFSSSKSINAVIVKGGPSANVYVYDPATMSGGPLVAPSNKDISHIEFCYGSTASVTIIKEVTTNGGGTLSTVMFPFTVSGQFADGFNLVDNNNVGPDRKIYSNITAFGAVNKIIVSENPFGTGFQLNDIDCSGGVTVPTFNNMTNGGSVEITVQAGDSVVCTFKNGQSIITAAGADIAGRVIDNNGRPIGRTVVTVLNTNNLESRSVITNRYGYFSFQEMTVGDFYLISVNSKGYWFAANNQGIGLTDNLTELEFIGTPFNNPVIGSGIFDDVIKSKKKQP